MATERFGTLGRRQVLKGFAAGSTLAAASTLPGFVQAQSSAPMPPASFSTFSAPWAVRSYQRP